MSRASLALAAILAALYIGFWFWWGGRDAPLTAAETDDYLRQLALESSRSRIRLIEHLPPAPQTIAGAGTRNQRWTRSTGRDVGPNM